MTAFTTMEQQDQKWKNKKYKLQNLQDILQFHK